MRGPQQFLRDISLGFYVEPVGNPEQSEAHSTVVLSELGTLDKVRRLRVLDAAPEQSPRGPPRG